jgi:hypothetical protein
MIGIVFIGDLKYCPYLNKYTQVLEQEEKKYEILFWNREAKNIEYPDNYLSFDLKSVLSKKPIQKSLDFMKYTKWVNKKIKQHNYSKIIVLSTISGIIIFNKLIKKYKDKYILDIRDYSYEHMKIFYHIEKKLIYNSYFTSISSKGFETFLPKGYSYELVHNFNQNEMSDKYFFKKKKYGDALNIVWIGAVRYFEHQKLIIDRLKNDSRFNLFYHGSGPDLEKFKQYCSANNILNVKFTGEYDNLEKPQLLEDADILNNCYKIRNEMKVKYAISNKYYDGLIYKIPQLVETGTYKHEKVEGIKVGIGLDAENKNFADDLYNYYFSLQGSSFNDNCEKELISIINQDRSYLKKIREFILS